MVLAVPRSNFPRLAVAGYRLRGCVRYWSRMAFWLAASTFQKEARVTEPTPTLKVEEEETEEARLSQPGVCEKCGMH